MSDLFSARAVPPQAPAPPPGPALALAPAPPAAAPPAPPLPPQRYVHRATNALARFAQPFIGGTASRPPSAHGNRDDRLHERNAPTPLPRSSSPLTSQTASHRTGIAIAAVDISPQRTHAVLAGREILKTIRVSGANCAEEFNIRAAIIAYSSTHNTTAGASAVKHKDDLAAIDVKWSHGNFDSHIATACPNGRIMLYDINRAGVESARLDEHNRQVHRLAFNPHQGYLMLSASQDATIRLWDLRATQGGRNVLTFRSSYKYKGNSEGIRDVKWSPTDGTGFACATDAGVVQRWDFRKDKAPLQKINAHKRICMSIDWHPDGKHLVSAGLDKQVQVWDVSSSARRQNSPWSFRTPQAVTKVRWRPAGWRAGAHGPGTWETTQLVTAYTPQDPRVHLWDIKSPYVPSREIDRYNHAPTDLLWHSEDLLWTVGVEGMFTQTDIHFAPKVEDRRPLQAFDVSPDGELTFFARPRSRRHDATFDNATRGITISGSSRDKGSGEKLSGSRSSTENDMQAGYLSLSSQQRYGRTSSSKSSKSLGNTPPADYTNVVASNLNETLAKKAKVEHGQLAASGRVLGSFDPVVFRHLVSGSHLARADRKIRRSSQVDWVRLTVEHNAKCARAVGMYRLSQTWRIVGHTAMVDAWSRARRRREQRLAEEAKRKRSIEKSAIAADATNAKVKHKPVVKIIPRSNSRDLQGSAIAESTSNLATPLAKPLPDSPHSHRNDSPAASLSGDDPFTLPPPQYKRSNTSDFTRRKGSFPSSSASLEYPYNSPSRYDALSKESERRIPSSQRRPPLRLDTPGERIMPASQGGRGPRRTSSESFIMFSASTGGRSSFPGSSFPGSSLGSEQAVSYGERREIRLESPIHEDEGFPPIRRQTTASSGVTESTSHDTIAFSDEFSAYEEGIEAGEAIGADDADQRDLSQLLSPPQPPTKDFPSPKPRPSSDEQDPASTDFIATDFLPPSPIDGTMTTLAGESTTPWTSPTTLLSQTLTYHLDALSDHLTPSLLLLLLSPLLPPKTDSNPAIPPELETSLLLTLHHQLISLSLFTAAAHLRNLTSQSHPDVSAFAKENVSLVFRCQGCGGRPATVSTRRIQRTSWLCDKCGYLQAACPICCRRHGMGRWAWCQGCGHGGHARCLDGWWAEPEAEGGCAVEGCLHDCIKGARRAEREAERLRLERDRKGVSGVRRDDWVAGESRAVKKVRGGLLSSRAVPDEAGGSAAATTKKVTLLTPGEQGL